MYQLRVVLETSSESHPVNSGDALAGDQTYQDSCNRLYMLLSAFEGYVRVARSRTGMYAVTRVHSYTFRKREMRHVGTGRGAT